MIWYSLLSLLTFHVNLEREGWKSEWRLGVLVTPVKLHIEGHKKDLYIFESMS